MQTMRRLRLLLLIFSLGILPTLSGERFTAAAQAGTTIAVSDPYCVQASQQSGVCYINPRYFDATGSDPSFSHIEISIDGKVRFYMTGFFETSAYLDHSMLGKGLQVPCGNPNASGIPGYGLQYQVTLSAYVGGTPITDIANVSCPYFDGRIFLPVVRK